MCHMCQIVPQDVLKRLAKDKSLSAGNRKSFADTARLDLQLRRLRSQAMRLSRLATAISPGLTAIAAAPTVAVYDCKSGQTLPGSPISNPAKAQDVTAKQVFGETTSVAAFYSKVFGRNSIDGSGMTLLSSIHYGISYNNAFWNGAQMSYGDGDGAIFVDFSKGNDVICHELTHGVTQHSLQLDYVNEAGGLNESLSDCFGSMFRQWEAKQDVNQADWLIGKDIIGPTAAARGYTCLRDMADPDAQHCLAPQPTQYSQYQPGMDPHYSSGIPSLAFSTICKAVGGNSWDKVGQIWYNVLTGSGAKPQMTMKDFADRTRAAAGQLYPGDKALGGHVDSGWKHVGL
jgi:Zn-dependent metalloprotease